MCLLVISTVTVIPDKVCERDSDGECVDDETEVKEKSKYTKREF